MNFGPSLRQHVLHGVVHFDQMHHALQCIFDLIISKVWAIKPAHLVSGTSTVRKGNGEIVQNFNHGGPRAILRVSKNYWITNEDVKHVLDAHPRRSDVGKSIARPCTVVHDFKDVWVLQNSLEA